MLTLKNAYTDDETLLLTIAARAGDPIDPKVVLSILNQLFATAEYDDHLEYVIDTAGVVPERPGPERDKMWEWIERTEKRLGIDVEVWGSRGEYLTPTTVNGCTYALDDFGWEDDFNYIEHALAENLRQLVEFHRAWREFAAATARSKGEVKRA
jgi:hypothetical protein